MDVIPETFVDALGEISFKHGMIRIEMVSLSGPEPRVTQRLITSLQSFTQMLQAQNGMFEQLEKAGLLRRSGVTAPGLMASSTGAAQGGEEAPAGEGAEANIPEITSSASVGAAVRRLLRVQPEALPAAPPAESEPPPRAEPAPPRSPNFRHG